MLGSSRDFHFPFPAVKSIQQVASVATKFLQRVAGSCATAHEKWAVRLTVGCQPANLGAFLRNSRTLHRPSFSPKTDVHSSDHEPMLYCPVCSLRLTERKCKLFCEQCGYFMSCADYN